MTIGAGIPLPFVLSAIDWEIRPVVIKCGRLPSADVVTGRAICPKSKGGVIRIIGAGIIVAVTPVTIGRKLIVWLSLMTSKAGEIIMAAGEWEETVVKSVTTPFK